jgi:hypothetical protein
MIAENAFKYYRGLRSAGIPEEQALKQSEALDVALENIATKEDLREVTNRLISISTIVSSDVVSIKNKIDSLELDARSIKEDLKDLKGESRRTFWAVISTIVGGIITLVIRRYV